MPSENKHLKEFSEAAQAFYFKYPEIKKTNFDLFQSYTGGRRKPIHAD